MTDKNLSMRGLARLTDVNREYIRQACRLRELRPDLLPALEAGSLSMGPAYYAAIGDNRVSLTVRIDADTKDRLRDMANRLGVPIWSLADYVLAAGLTQLEKSAAAEGMPEA